MNEIKFDKVRGMPGSFVIANLSRLAHNPCYKYKNHRLAEIRRQLGAAKYRSYLRTKPARGRSPIVIRYGTRVES